MFLTIFAGAAAFVSHTNDDLENIVIYDDSHVVIESDQTVNDVLGDGRSSMIHVVKDSTLNITGKMTAHAYLDTDSALQYFAFPTVQLTSSINVTGSFSLMYPEKQSLVLADSAALNINSTSTTIINCTVLEINQNAALKISNDADVFNLQTIDFKVFGIFSVQELKIYDLIQKFTVGSNGKVEFDPISSSMSIGQNIDIRGKVTLQKHISFTGPCSQILLERGTLTWPATSDIIRINCSVVNINSVFTPGIVSFEKGINQLIVGSSGTFTIVADGPVRANTVSIAGKMTVKNLVTFGSPQDQLIAEFGIHSPGGLLQLNSMNLPAQTDSVATSQTCSVLKVKSLTVDKTFYAGKLDVDKGIDDVTMNDEGHWKFLSCDILRIGKLNISGSITSTAVSVTVEAREIYVRAGGKISADAVTTSGPGSGNNQGSGGII